MNILSKWERENILYNYIPSPGGQMRAWMSTKPQAYILGSNRGGKTYLLKMLVAGYLLEHPNDSGYAYWPNIPGDEELTWKLRETTRIKLPTNVWMSEESRKTHREITMGGFENRPDMIGFREILGPYISQEQYSDEKDVWDFIILEPYGSRLTLKTSEAGPGAYRGPVVDLVCIDEPQNPAIITECIARTSQSEWGRVVYACTPVVDPKKPNSWADILWLKNEVLTKGENDMVDIIMNMTIEENIGLTQRQRDRIRTNILASAMSEEEKQTRLYGEILLMEGMNYFSVGIASKLLKQAKPPLFTGYLEE